MSNAAFVSSFNGLAISSRSSSLSRRNKLCRRRYLCQHAQQGTKLTAKLEATTSRTQAKPRRIVGIVAKARSKDTKKSVEADSGKSLFGMKANAYWESIGVLPLFFAGFGVFALAIKMLKVKSGELRSGPSGVNKVTTPKSAITSEAEEAELHVFKCGGCGYEMYPARGREFKFFPDSFKCPLCGTPKSEFWDLNDPDDPRNQEEEEEEDEEDDTEGGEPEISPAEGNGSSAISSSDQVADNSGTETAAKDRTETDPSN